VSINTFYEIKVTNLSQGGSQTVSNRWFRSQWSTDALPLLPSGWWLGYIWAGSEAAI